MQVDFGAGSAHCPPPPDTEVEARLSHLQRGWYWGSQEFAERLLKLGSNVIGKKRERGYQFSAERRAHDESEAERLLKTGLATAGTSRSRCAQGGHCELDMEPGLRRDLECRVSTPWMESSALGFCLCSVTNRAD